MKKLILATIILAYSASVFSQSTWIRTSVSAEKNISVWEYNGTHISLGVEHQFSENWGIGVDLESVTTYDVSKGMEFNYISLPVGIKLYTHPINIELGPAITLDMGWKNNNPNNNVESRYFRGIGIDFNGKVSHSFPLSKHIQFEPGLVFRSFEWDWYLGLGLGLKIGRK